MLSLMFAPHSGRGLLRFAGYAHGPFFIMPSYIDGKQLVLQTIFIAVLFALIVNIPWRWKKDDRDSTPLPSPTPERTIAASI